MPKLSIIIPVYNREMTLHRCLESVAMQTLIDFEAIIVNDGSSDRSGEICDSFAARDRRFNIIHTANHGPGAARNIGLDTAKGDFIGFVDSDDWVEPTMFQSMTALAALHAADVVLCSHFCHEENCCVVRDDSGRIEIWNNREFAEMLAADDTVRSYLWDKLFRKDVLETIRFRSGQTLAEDVSFATRYLPRVSRCVYTATPCYHYVRHGATITGEWRAEHLPGAFLAFKERHEFLVENYPSLVDRNLRKLAPFARGAFNSALESRDVPDEWASEVRLFLMEHFSRVMTSMAITKAEKIRLLLLVKTPTLYITMRRVQVWTLRLRRKLSRN